jgi:hypothetical protein
MVAREGIELATKALRFTVFHKTWELSYPRCYPHVILANRQLNRGHPDFQPAAGVCRGLQINHLQWLADPFPGTILAHQLDTFLTHRGKQPTWSNPSNSLAECFILSVMAKEYLGVDDR